MLGKRHYRGKTYPVHSFGLVFFKTTLFLAHYEISFGDDGMKGA
jgi:hypothetical protein